MNSHQAFMEKAESLNMHALNLAEAAARRNKAQSDMDWHQERLNTLKAELAELAKEVLNPNG